MKDLQQRSQAGLEPGTLQLHGQQLKALGHQDTVLLSLFRRRWWASVILFKIHTVIKHSRFDYECEIFAIWVTFVIFYLEAALAKQEDMALEHLL